MRTCPYCASNNREGIFFCEECGQVLFGENAVTKTHQLPGGGRTTSFPEGSKNNWGTARFTREAAIMLHIKDNPTPIQINPESETTIGRSDVGSPTRPTVDMTPYGAYENGVSRLHAVIRRGEDTLTLVDLGSVNGTHLNGQRLNPNQPRVLRDGDEIRFGKLTCHIFFKMVEPHTP